MRSAPAPAPPPPMGRVTPPQSAPAEEVLLQAPVLQVSECAASYQPPPAGPALTPTPRTSGTRATPAHTPPPAEELVPSPYLKSLTISVS